MKDANVRKITGIAILMAIDIILQTIGNFITLPGGLAINLSLIPIALAGIVYGPFGGALVGLTNGVMVLLAPSTQAVFMPYAPFATVVTCLIKTTVAGLLSGLVYKAISKKNTLVASIVASILVPLVNTALFALASFTIISEAIKNLNANSMNIMRYVFLIMIGWNFVIEVAITSILTPSIDKLRKIMTRSNKHAL